MKQPKIKVERVMGGYFWKATVSYWHRPGTKHYVAWGDSIELAVLNAAQHAVISRIKDGTIKAS